MAREVEKQLKDLNTKLDPVVALAESALTDIPELKRRVAQLEKERDEAAADKKEAKARAWDVKKALLVALLSLGVMLTGTAVVYFITLVVKAVRNG